MKALVKKNLIMQTAQLVQDRRTQSFSELAFERNPSLIRKSDVRGSAGEFYVNIGSIFYPSPSSVDVWIGDYGVDKKAGILIPRIWFGLSFPTWKTLEEFLDKLNFQPKYFYDDSDGKVLATKGWKKLQKTQRDNSHFEHLVVEHVEGIYYFGKYLRKAVSKRNLSAICDKISDFSSELIGAAEKALKSDPVKSLNAWGKKSQRQVTDRPDQLEFRMNLIKLYHGKCAISDCKTEQALVAAHIKPFREDQDQSNCNGILLRADLHNLFDTGLLSIGVKTRGKKVEYYVKVSDTIGDSTYYKEFDGTVLKNVPSKQSDRPNTTELKKHMQNLK